jgi:hypothetical protein
MTKRGDIIRAHLEEFQSIPAHAFIKMNLKYQSQTIQISKKPKQKSPVSGQGKSQEKDDRGI